MSLDLSDRVIVITGASRGLGLELTKYLANTGASLGIVARSKKNLNDLASRLPTEVVAIACDVTDEEQVSLAFQDVWKKFGRIDSVIANVGGLPFVDRAENISADRWRKVIDLNLTGAFITAREAYSYLRNSVSGRLLFVSSGAANYPTRGMSAYASSKAGVEGLTRALCTEWAKDQICVNAIAPGFFDVGGTENVDEKNKRRILGNVALRRVGQASEIFYVVHLLVSDGASYINGQVIPVDGGCGLS